MMANHKRCSVFKAFFLVLAFGITTTTASLSQLGNMIDCSTKNAWIQYVGYGCYCGPGGQGPALDPVDSCCKAHDHCYDRIMHGSDCKNPLEVYMDEYKVTGCTKCDPKQSTCQLEICKCDAAIANCLKGKPLNPRTNEKKYKCKKKTNAHKKNYYKRDYMNIDYNDIDYDSLYKLW